MWREIGRDDGLTFLGLTLKLNHNASGHVVVHQEVNLITTYYLWLPHYRSLPQQIFMSTSVKGLCRNWSLLMSEKGVSVWRMSWCEAFAFLHQQHSNILQPNLKPPITTTAQALDYKAKLEKLDPSVEFLMTLYLSPDLTPDEIRKAKKAGIVGLNL